MKCINCNDEIENKTNGTMLCRKCYNHMFLSSDHSELKTKILKKKKKVDSIIWWISFIIAFTLKDIVYGFIGFKDKSFTNGFDMLNFMEGILIIGVCFGSVHYLVTVVYNKIVKVQNEKLGK